MRIALVQMPVVTLAVEDNLARGRAWVAKAAAAGADLVVLPELWTTGFHWPKNVQMAASQGAVLDSVVALAKEYSVWIAGSLLTTNEEGKPANAALLCSPEAGIVARYDKMHLFSLTGEDRYLSPGSASVVESTPWGPVGLAVCYDVRFPELWRMMALAGAQLILCPAGFPEPRQEHWRTLLRARAIENQCFVAGVNQTGTQTLAGGPPLTYFGGSCLYDPWGECLLEGDASERMLIADIDLQDSLKTRQKMTVMQDRRPDVYRL